METKGYYALVGFFVTVLSAVGLIIALWLSVGINKKPQTNYAIYMNESVSGLSLSAPVKYNGVEVGAVKKIALLPADPNQVLVVIAIDEDTPISTATHATLNMQGVTGITYVELSGGDPAAPPLTIQPGQKYPVIASTPSLIFRMHEAIDKLSENLQKMTGSIGQVFNEKNGQLMQNTLENINAASRRLNNAVGSAEFTIQRSNVTLETINNQMLPQLTNLLDDVDGVTLRLDGFIQQLSDNPSMLIRGQAPTPLGPGETRNTTQLRN